MIKQPFIIFMILKLRSAIFLAPVLLRKTGELVNTGICENARTWRKMTTQCMHALLTTDIF
jgi:hypothetical protein